MGDRHTSSETRQSIKPRVRVPTARNLRWSGKRAKLPPLSPLGIARAYSHACSSSIGQRTCYGTRLSALAWRTTCTLLRESQQRNRRKPHQQERYTPPTFLHCFLKSVCSRFTYANTRGKSAGFRRGVMSFLSNRLPLPLSVRLKRTHPRLLARLPRTTRGASRPRTCGTDGAAVCRD